MLSQVNGSEEKFVDLLISKLASRCEEVRWGCNADSVREALKFEEEIFASDFESEEEKNEFFQFLLKEGFQPKKTRIDGIFRTEWYFSVNSKNTKISDFLEVVTRDYENALNASKEIAKDVIESFINSEEYFKYFVTNDVEKKALNEEVVKYNQETFVYNNRRNANYQRPFIIDFPHPKYPIVLIFKQRENVDILLDAEQYYLGNFWNNISRTLYMINQAIMYADLSKRKMIVYINKEYSFGFKLFLEGCGLKVDYFSNRPKSEYVDVRVSSDSANNCVAMFVEISKPLVYTEVFAQNNDTVMKNVLGEYKRFCMTVNNKVFR